MLPEQNHLFTFFIVILFDDLKLAKNNCLNNDNGHFIS